MRQALLLLIALGTMGHTCEEITQADLHAVQEVLDETATREILKGREGRYAEAFVQAMALDRSTGSGANPLGGPRTGHVMNYSSPGSHVIEGEGYGDCGWINFQFWKVGTAVEVWCHSSTNTIIITGGGWGVVDPSYAYQSLFCSDFPDICADHPSQAPYWDAPWY